MPIRRELRFTALDDIIRDAEHLLSAGYDKAGQWDLAQVCNHLANWVKYPMDGFPPVPLLLKPVMWIAKRTMMPKFERQLREHRSMPPGIPTAPASVTPPGQDEAAAVVNLRDALRRFETYTGPIHPSPLRGVVSKDCWMDTHLIHGAHHLSFLLPKSPFA
jgi:hypothetical protein